MSRRIIDIHNHPNWYGVDVDDLVANMDEKGIEKTWLLSWESTLADFDVSPEYHAVMDPRGLSAPLWMVVEGLKRHPDRFIGGWAPDPADRYARAKVKSAVDLHGIRVYGELKWRMRYDNPDAIAMFRFCAELGLPVLFHLECTKHAMARQQKDMSRWVPWYGGDASVVENMCRLCPDTQFIGHGPGFWMDISGDADEATGLYPDGPVQPGGQTVRLLREYPNLHCDLSAGSGCNALNRDLEHARAFVEEFQGRIMFGRDAFDMAQLDVLEKLDLSDEIMDKLLHRNAEALLEKREENEEQIAISD